MEKGTLTICEVTEENGVICIIAKALLYIHKGDLITHDIINGPNLYIEDMINCNPDEECRWKLVCKIQGSYPIPSLTAGTVMITPAGMVFTDNEPR